MTTKHKYTVNVARITHEQIPTGRTWSGLRDTNVSQCSNGITCTDQIVVSTKQSADSIKINIFSAHVFINLVCGDSEAVMWYTLVRHVVN